MAYSKIFLCFYVVSEGFVVANDSDNKRCYLMVRQVRRLASCNYLVMNMDASTLPAFIIQVTSHIINFYCMAGTG